MVEENETEEGSGETQEEEVVEGEDAVKTKKPNGFDMFSDDLSMFAEAHSVSTSVVLYSMVCVGIIAVHLCWCLFL